MGRPEVTAMHMFSVKHKTGSREGGAEGVR